MSSQEYLTLEDYPESAPYTEEDWKNMEMDLEEFTHRQFVKRVFDDMYSWVNINGRWIRHRQGVIIGGFSGL